MVCDVVVQFSLYYYYYELVHAHPHEPDSVTLKLEAV
jgi:hypothetical protein